MRSALIALLPPLTALVLAAALRANDAHGPQVGFAVSTDAPACYDYVEVTVRVTNPPGAGFAADASVKGSFGLAGQPPVEVMGFVDAADGGTHRIRFMPSIPGRYDYTIWYQSDGCTRTHEGSFTARDERHKGLVRADPQHPGVLQWEGTQERFFWNGLVADELTRLAPADMEARLDQLDRCRVTSLCLRLALPVEDREAWGRVERVVSLARDRAMVVAVALADGSAGPGPAECSSPMQEAAARLAAFSNMVWELPSDAPGRAALAAADPYHHVSAEGVPALSLEPSAAGASPSAEATRVAWQRALAGAGSTVSLERAPGLVAGGELEAVLAPLGPLYDFFTSMPWWELRPDEALVVSVRRHSSAPGTAEPQTFAARNAEGDLAAIYVAGGGIVTLQGDLLKDQLKPLWFSPRDGGMRNAPALRERVYRTPTADDWVLVFRTPCNCSFRDFDSERED